MTVMVLWDQSTSGSFQTQVRTESPASVRASLSRTASGSGSGRFLQVTSVTSKGLFMG